MNWDINIILKSCITTQQILKSVFVCGRLPVLPGGGPVLSELPVPAQKNCKPSHVKSNGPFFCLMSKVSDLMSWSGQALRTFPRGSRCLLFCHRLGHPVPRVSSHLILVHVYDIHLGILLQLVLFASQPQNGFFALLKLSWNVKCKLWFKTEVNSHVVLGMKAEEEDMEPLPVLEVRTGAAGGHNCWVLG